MTDPDINNPVRRFGVSSRTAIILGALATLGVGGAAGAVAGHAMRPAIEMAPLKPVAIRSLAAGDGVITIRGRIAEVFGNKLIVDDSSGRALVETGPAGDDALAAVGALVTVQGRYDRGVVHASFLVDPAGKVVALAPMHGPGERGPHGPPPPGDRPLPPPPMG